MHSLMSTTPERSATLSGGLQASRDISRETIVVLREGSPRDVPLIIMHGSEGTIGVFAPLRKKFSSALWAIQLTSDIPITTLEEQVHCYYQKIKAKRPKGPYRLASFSATSFILVALAHMFEGNGDEIQHLYFIDNFPTIHFAPGFDWTKFSRDTAGLQSCLDANMNMMVDLIRRDNGGHDARRHKLADDLAVGYGYPEDAAPHTLAFLDTVSSHIVRLWKFLGIYGRDLTMFGEWVQGIKAPMTVFVASEGMLAHMHDVDMRKEWCGFGVHRFYPDAAVVYVKAGHFQVLGHELVVAGLQAGQKVQAHL